MRRERMIIGAVSRSRSTWKEPAEQTIQLSLSFKSASGDILLHFQDGLARAAQGLTPELTGREELYQAFNPRE
jgi:hypothetical protein